MEKTYLRRFSSTFLAILKMLAGLFALAWIVIEILGVTRITYAVKDAAAQAGLELESLTDVLTNAMNLVSPSGELAAIVVSTLLAIRGILIASVVILVLLTLVGPILTFLDGIGALLIRFAGKCGLTKVVHLLRAISELIKCLFLTSSTVTLLLNQKRFMSAFPNKDDALIMLVLSCVILLFSAFIALLRFRYHKDIIEDVSAISDDCHEDDYHRDDPELIKNHLSILAVLAAILHFAAAAISFLLIILTADVIDREGVLTNTGFDSNLIFVVLGGLLILAGIRYLLVSSSAKALREDFKARGLEIRPMTTGERMIILLPSVLILALMIFGSHSNAGRFETFISNLDQKVNSAASSGSLTESGISDVEELVIPPAKDDTEIREGFKVIIDDSEKLSKKYSEFIRGLDDPSSLSFTEQAASAAFLVQFADVAGRLSQWNDATLTTAEKQYAEDSARRISEQYPEIKDLTPEALGISAPEGFNY